MKEKHAAERKAEQQRQKEARDSQKASQPAQKGKRKASQKAASRKKQNRGTAAVRSGGVPASPAREALTQLTRSGRTSTLPQRFI